MSHESMLTLWASNTWSIYKALRFNKRLRISSFLFANENPGINSDQKDGMQLIA